MMKQANKDFQAEVRESAHKIWLAGLGALAAAGEEGEKLFNRLVEKGEEMEGRGKDKVDAARSRVESAWGDVEKTFDEKIASALHRLGVPTRDEIRELTRKVENLTAKIHKLDTKKAAAKAN
jgi:poly(hydroxyalkanoate) granule-associated protein